MKNLTTLFTAAIALAVAFPQAAYGARLSFTGDLHLNTANESPVEGARIKVTFHGHEVGIHEYTTERSARAITLSDGSFAVDVKLSEYRYRWTHATLEVAETDISKEATLTIPLYEDGRGGFVGTKRFGVSPLGQVVNQAIDAIKRLKQQMF